MFADHNCVAELERVTSYQSAGKRQTPISAIAWDLDNTLFDRDAAMARFFRSWLAERLRGVGSRRMEALMKEVMVLDDSGNSDRLKFCERVIELCRMQVDEMDFMDAIDNTLPPSEALWKQIQQELPAFVQPEPRVLALMDQLAVPMAIVSNGGGSFQRAKAARAGLDPRFPTGRIFTSEEVGAKKPDRKMFDAVLKLFEVRPESVLFVGDHPVNDIAGAASTGMQTCWVSHGRDLPAILPADFVIGETWELESLSLVFTPVPFRA